MFSLNKNYSTALVKRACCRSRLKQITHHAEQRAASRDFGTLIRIQQSKLIQQLKSIPVLHHAPPALVQESHDKIEAIRNLKQSPHNTHTETVACQGRYRSGLSKDLGGQARAVIGGALQQGLGQNSGRIPVSGEALRAATEREDEAALLSVVAARRDRAGHGEAELVAEERGQVSAQDLVDQGLDTSAAGAALEQLGHQLAAKSAQGSSEGFAAQLISDEGHLVCAQAMHELQEHPKGVLRTSGLADVAFEFPGEVLCLGGR
mmetsp:Transcript_28038/g.80468  ORF Transcript_28038/g.80468 Transcript_28038/m.80468 type:complete len:263 (-) Transcript_28038:473-1261(-)